MPVLDAEELLHLGLHATKNNDPQGAIEHLKRCIEADPLHSRAMYLLGALYAQIGMYDRASNHLRQAVELNPQEFTAIFQLGLLHLTSGEAGQAASVWSALDALDGQHFLYLFKSGMLALAADRFAECIDLLDRGIAANTANDALNDDMRRVRAAAAAALAGGAAAEDAEASANHIVLSGYQQAQNK